MPLYTYRREDGTTFDLKQKFSDAPLTVDPETGQNVVRVVHAAGVIFKGSGFYVNDSKGSSTSTMKPGAKKDDTKTETETKTKTETKTEAASTPAAAAD